MFQYDIYETIPVLTGDYLVTVADVEKLEQLSLEDINTFLNGLEDFENEQA
ncbi:MAG: hypothetical protein WD512_11220 [Candidatus Paceibacterota bacterium]